jgi:hypothetical protein
MERTETPAEQLREYLGHMIDSPGISKADMLDICAEVAAECLVYSDGDGGYDVAKMRQFFNCVLLAAWDQGGQIDMLAGLQLHAAMEAVDVR